MSIRELNIVQQLFFLLSTEWSIVIIRAYPALYLGGTPSRETCTSPSSCLLLKNHLYISPKWLTLIFFKLQAWHHPGKAKTLCVQTKKIHMYTTYSLKIEKSLSKRRVATYISKKVKYNRWSVESNNNKKKSPKKTFFVKKL